MGLSMYAYAVSKKWRPAPVVKDLGVVEFYDWGKNRFMLYLVKIISKQKGGDLSDEYIELTGDDIDFIEKAVSERCIDGKTAVEIMGREYNNAYDLEFIKLAREYLANDYMIYFWCS